MNLKEQLINAFALCESKNCLEEICLQEFEVIDNQQNAPCRLLTLDYQVFFVCGKFT